MKSAVLTIAILINSLFIIAQPFEGKVVYQNTYKSKIANLTDVQLSTMMGSVQNYYISGGNYKSETNGTLMLWQLYINSDNKLYNKLSNSETVLWNDASLNTDEVLSVELNRNAAEILGYQCDELVLTCKSGVQKYYFTPKFPIDAKLYEKHLYGNWYAYLAKANALPIRMVIDNAQFTIESVATEIKPSKLDKAMFALPVNIKTGKSPY